MKQRVISAIIASIIVLPIIYLGGYWFEIGCCVLALLALKEILMLKENTNKVPILVQFLVMVSSLLLISTGFHRNLGINWNLNQSLVLISVLLFFPTLMYHQDNYKSAKAVYLLGWVLLIGMAFNSFIVIRNASLNLFIYLLLIATMTDIFAYIFGLLIGRIPISPHISPKKTWAGSILGTFVAVYIASIFYHMTINPVTWQLILSTISLSVVGQIGDLIFSKVKRDNQVKDFSNLMPGHGGVLDRLDSIIFIVLTYLIIFNFK